MQTINLKQYYPFCKEDIFVEVSDEIVEAFLLDKRAEAARERKMFRYTPNFSDIYTLYFEDVYKYLLALCHDEELAEELAQDTFFKAMKSYENFRGDCKITTWLCQIAKHSFFLYEKHRKRNIDLNSVENEIVDTNSIEILLGQREQAFGIHKLLHNLPEPYKEVFSLRVLGELSYQDIAKLFGKTESWARVTFHRAKLKIIEQVKEESYE